MKKIINWYKEKDEKIRLILTIISGVSLGLSLLLRITRNNEVIFIDIAWVAIVLCGVPIIVGALTGVIKDHDITADVLVSMALIGSLILKKWFAAGEVAFIMQIGSILEDYTSKKAKSGIDKLIKLSPKTARVVRDGEERAVKIEEVKIGDILIVLAGETIPVDGIIVSGNTSINQAVITGESIPVDKGPKDNVISGTINQFGTFTYQATNEEKNSSLQRMILLAKEADSNQANIVKKADKWAVYLVIIAFTITVLTGLIVGIINDNFWIGFERAVTVLVVFCPCAFILATPTAIVAGIGNATKKGIIIRSGEALEKIAECKYVAFDKTGTLTYGKPEVVGIESLSIDKEELLKIAASGEKMSEHPLGKAIVNAYKNELYKIDNFKVLIGSGIEFTINDKNYFIGKNIDCLNKNAGIVKTYIDTGSTIIYVVENNIVLGFLALADTLRSEAKKMVQEIKEIGLTPILLTGDNEYSAKSIANQVGIEEVKANLLPVDKMSIIKELSINNQVCMFGDGVNDALALKTAHAGVAMGGIGSDIAVESSDAVLVNDDVKVIPYLFKIANKTLKKININIIISLVINFGAVVCSILGLLNPIWGAIVHNCGSVFVVINSLALLLYKQTNRHK